MAATVAQLDQADNGAETEMGEQVRGAVGGGLGMLTAPPAPALTPLLRRRRRCWRAVRASAARRLTSRCPTEARWW